MKLQKIFFKNYRLLTETELNIDDSTTLIVGRNNTAKTSCLEFIYKVVTDKTITYDDYPLAYRTELISLITQYLNGEIDFSTLLSSYKIPLIRFEIDYSLEKDDELLGALSPFIIDISVDTSIAIIEAKYMIEGDDSAVKKNFESCTEINENGEILFSVKLIREKIIEIFHKLFRLKIFAVNPKDKDDIQQKLYKELTDLFPIYSIFAERYLGESGDEKGSSLTSIVSRFFNIDMDEVEPKIKEKINDLRKNVEEANNKVKDVSESLLSQLVDNTIGFGYPNGEELELGVKTTVDISNQIQNTAELTYKLPKTTESLPSSYNGLGYKNLLKIEFELAAFTEVVKAESLACIPLLFVEEPESHMHPQLQQTFANYLETFLKKLSSIHIQVLITTHSSHIANTIDLSKIRYAQRIKNGVIYKDLNSFAKINNENVDFIKKYLTISRCDLFFADKAIFVEGASERLLLPDMIKKCDELKLFDSVKYKLPSQYYSVIEVGGAYAHKFIPFMEFLGIPCLIITDIDPCIDGRTKSYVSNGKTTTNSTIKWWICKAKNYMDNSQIELVKDIVNLPELSKTFNNCHIEYQIIENGICGRSLEESIININRDFFGVKQNAVESDLIFPDKNKTDFALRLITECPNYQVPEYIKNGLVWLNAQNVIG